MQPIIGVASRFILCGRKTVIGVRKEYLDVVKQYDFIPLIIPFSADAERVMKCCDALLIPGGDDINPSIYHEGLNPATNCSPEMEDQLDLTIAAYATKYSIPLLGICRGIQIMNVFGGGSLFQDINNHQDTTHPLIWSPSALLPDSRYLYTTVNSFHHQAIRQLASDFRVTATSKDGIIEAIEHNSLPQFAVQWHPEKEADSPLTKLLLTTLWRLANRSWR